MYSFEPELNNYNVILKNIELNGYTNAIVNQKAVSDKAGVVKLYLSNIDVGAHTLREKHNHPQFSESKLGDYVEVEAVVLDDYLKDDHIDVVKIDAEGADMAVILGMDRIIRSNKNLKMFVEFYPSALREMGYSPEGLIKKLLNGYGFSILANDELRTKKVQTIKINSVSDLMGLCEGKEKIINLFLCRE